MIQSLGARLPPGPAVPGPARHRCISNDGRNFLRRAPDGEYDLVIFALVDSLVLHSGYSNLRLESFLFTAESFRDVRRVLKPAGVAAVYNFFRQGWIAVRLNEVLKSAFGGEPVVLTDPPRDEITMDAVRRRDVHALLGGSRRTSLLRECGVRAGGVVLAAQRPAARPGRARPVRRGRTATAYRPSPRALPPARTGPRVAGCACAPRRWRPRRPTSARRLMTGHSFTRAYRAYPA